MESQNCCGHEGSRVLFTAVTGRILSWVKDRDHSFNVQSFQYMQNGQTPVVYSKQSITLQILGFHSPNLKQSPLIPD